jgi:pilus assembly protein CpaF
MTTHEAVAHVEGDVRELIRRSGLDPTRDQAQMRRLVTDAVQDYDERSLHGGLPMLGDTTEAVRSVLSMVAGYGPLQQYFDDPAVEEIWINEPSKVFIARGGTAELTSTILTSDDVRDLVERMLKTSGRRVDLSSPFVDATLADGSRLHVVIPDISREHWQVNIRKFVVRADHLDDLVRIGTLTKQAATFLGAAVASGLNILVAGGTQAGKTTLLNCLSAAIPPRDRIVTCEEVSSCASRNATWPRCSAGSRVSRAPARCPCGAWSRRRCGCVRHGSSSGRSVRRRASTCLSP